MKICQIMLSKGFGGAERAFVDSCAALQEKGLEVLAIVDQGSKSLPFLQQSCVPYKVIPLWFRQNPFAKRSLEKALIEYNPDIAHIHLRRAMDFAGPIVKKCNIRMVASVHNYRSVKTYSEADHIIALTNDHKDFIINTDPSLKHKITVITNFSKIIAKKHNIAEHQPTRFLSYGRFVHKKGFDVLINAFAKVFNKRKDVSLSVVGDGVLKPEIKKLISSHGLMEQIHLLPWADSIVELLDMHDVFILPSRIEPFGIVVIESMARGKLIISTLSEGPKQFLNEETALLCEVDNIDSLAEQILFAKENLVSLQKMADRANDYYKENFYVDQVVPLIEECYLSLINSE